MARKITYRSLLRQRAAVAGLTLGLVTVMIGVSIDLFATGRRSTIPATTQRLIIPLDPQLDISVIESIEGYQEVSVEEARRGVQQPQIFESPTPIPVPDQVPVVNPETGGFFQTQPTQSTVPTESSPFDAAELSAPSTDSTNDSSQVQTQGEEPILQP